MTQSLGFYPDTDNVIKREPYGANFKMGEFDFTLVVYHLRYGRTMATRRAEAAQLINIYQYFQSANGTEQDLLIGGDFNLPGNDAALTVVGYDDVTYLTDPEQKTSIGPTGLISSFDNIFFPAKALSEMVQSGAHDFTFNNHATVRETVSDHIPVWAAFDTTVDDD
jgi:deoxyribonuclease-1-like protein